MMTTTPATIFMARRLSRSLHRLPVATGDQGLRIVRNAMSSSTFGASYFWSINSKNGRQKKNCNFQNKCINYFSSDSSTETTAKKMKSLKNVIKPFFLKCHPDVQTAAVAKRVNLTAMQNLNGYLDLIEATIFDTNKRVEWPSTIMVEFLISKELTGPKYAMRKKKPEPVTTRKRVELVVPPKKLRDAIANGGQGGFSSSDRDRAIEVLLQRAKRELNKVLTVAGLPAPAYYERTGEDDGDEDDGGQRMKGRGSMDDLWDSELDFLDKNSLGKQQDLNEYGASSNMRFRSDMEQPQFNNAYERSRDKFTRNLDTKRIQKVYDEAIEDVKADIATDGYIRNHSQRRQKVIDDVLSKVRIDNNAVEDLELTDQLIALRRLSLILDDNFDEFRMEDMGRMWENMVIVLVPERTYSTSSSAIHKRKKRQKETGFRFTYSADEIVIVHIPIDFGDEELVEEFHRNLDDFNRLVGDGLEDLYPSWLKEYAYRV